LLVFGDEDAVDFAREQLSKADLAKRERQPAEVLAFAGEHVEGIEQHPLVVLALGQRVEVRDSVSCNDEWEVLGPIIAAPAD
jgi:hypothetical protein